MNESDLKLYREYETLNQLQKDLQNLKYFLNFRKKKLRRKELGKN